MSEEIAILAALRATQNQHGGMKRLAEALGIHQSTVHRWLNPPPEKSEPVKIPAPMLLLLKCYYFGDIPPRLEETDQLPAILHFSESEWQEITHLAEQEHTTPRDWIASRIRSYLAYFSRRGNFQILSSNVAEDDENDRKKPRKKGH